MGERTRKQPRSSGFRRYLADVLGLRSLRGRLFVLIWLVMLPAFAGTYWQARADREATIRRSEQDALHLARLASREHEHQIQGVRQLLEWLGQTIENEGVESLWLEDSGLLRALLAGHPQLANIGVLSVRGEVLKSAYPLASALNWSENPAFQAALRRPGIQTGRYLISPIFGRPTLNHAYGVRDESGEVLAVLFTGLNLDWLSDLAYQPPGLDSAAVYITDRAGMVLAAIGAKPLPAKPERQWQLEGLDAVAVREEGDWLTIRGADTEAYLVASRMEATPDLLIGVTVPLLAISRKAQEAFLQRVLGLLLLTGFTTVAVFRVTDLSVLRTLQSLAQTVQLFGQGDLTARATYQGTCVEFAALSREFNAMADALASRETELVESQQRLRAMAHDLRSAREEEASRIARELHDEIGQVLTSLKMDLTRLQRHCPPGEAYQACRHGMEQSAAEMKGHIVQAIEFVRRISAELRPGVLDKLGLVAALDWQARELTASTGLRIRVEADNPEEEFAEALTVTLFRIAQEALVNVVRHAQAEEVVISLQAQDAVVTLRIHDDGIGIPPGKLTAMTSLGLLGMQERAALLGGVVSFERGPNQGTTVTARIPRTSAREVAYANPACG